MDKGEHIKQAIEKHVDMSTKRQLALWSIGITNYPDELKKKQGFPSGWYQWRVDSLAAAREIQSHYLTRFPADDQKRMKSGYNTRAMDQRKDAYVFIFPTEEGYY